MKKFMLSIMMLFIFLISAGNAEARYRNDSEMIGQLLIALVVMIAVFLICRELLCWYWKINERLTCLKDIRDLLQKNHDLLLKTLEKEQALNKVKIKPSIKGLKVSEISSGSQAEKLGIKKGDVIVSYDGTPTLSNQELSVAISKAKNQKKEHAEIVIFRDGKKWKIKVTFDPLGLVCTEYNSKP
ncbi:MAG: PDZ domain-containing protein [Desulfuromusa sp.]|nr:PDZ domain-containing protein [Desulfuromusa sp.]